MLRKSSSILFLSIISCNLYSETLPESTSYKKNIHSSGNEKQNDNQDNISEQEKMILELQKQIQQLNSEVNSIIVSQGYKNIPNPTDFKNYSSILGGSTVASEQLDNVSVSDIDNNINIETGQIILGSNPDKIIYKNGGIDVGSAPAITTGGKTAYLGAYSGNNTVPIGQIPDNLFASTIIGQREYFSDYSVFFGGFIEIDPQVYFGNSKVKGVNGNMLPQNGQNIYLTTANLYFLSNLGHYVTAQFDFDTDESNSFSLGNAFVIFGNLDTSPFFITAGKSYLSVGTYGGGGTITNGITDNFFEPGQVTNISLNYKDNVWNANIAVSSSNDKKANFSTGVFYADSWTDNLAAGFNIGYIYNLAGSSDSGSFEQFLEQNNRQGDTIGSFNVDGNLTYNLWEGFLNLAAGWATTTNREDFNGNGNNVLAGGWYTAANYSLTLAGKDTNFGVSYGQTYNAMLIPMALASSPTSFGMSQSGIKSQLIFSAQRSYFDNNVLFGPEYVYQKLYNNNSTNTITFDISVYI
ncbi:DUF3573 domain-containing protein [Francisella hispaniensis]|nr:DUF3573 domain-containing protein [Francisella hispaniensis]